MPSTKSAVEEIDRPDWQPVPVLQIGREKSRLDTFVLGHTPQIVALLTAFAAIRILVLAAAFPLTNNVDERFHLMTVEMYAHGHFPGRDLPRINPQFASTLLLYWSPEYGLSQETMDRNGITGPLYGLSDQKRDSALHRDYYSAKLQQWSRRLNFEAQSPPLYYLVAAGWYRLGAALGMRDWVLDYWVRFLNPIIYALLVGLSYWFVRAVYPDRVFLHLAVPALLAVFPQDVFFGMNRDVFSPTLVAAALLLMMRALGKESNRDRCLLLSSLIVGLAFVSSVSNCVLFGSLAITLCMWVRGSMATLWQKIGVVCASVLTSAGIPLLWMLRNYWVMGDLTGSKAKAHDLTWTVKPLADIFHHPLFSWRGLSYFLVHLTRSFWQGEYTWHQLPMRSAWADRFYILSSAFMVVIFIADFALRRKALSVLQRWTGFQALFLVASSVVFLGAISLLFDFQQSAYPSRLYPYFVSGRIMSGALLPFVLIYVSGLELLANRIQKWIPPVAILTCLLLFITVSEIRVRSVVFSSPYNFFALLADRH